MIFSLPVLGSNVLQSLNGSINAVWVGRFLGEAALTATSNANLVLFLILGTVFGIGMAATPGGGGYWIAESNGGIWPYGNAVGYGRAFPAFPISAIVTPPGPNAGYFLIGKDGGVFPFGSASGYLGSVAGRIPGNDVVGAALTLVGHGMWFARGMGQVVGLGDGGSYQ